MVNYFYIINARDNNTTVYNLDKNKIYLHKNEHLILDSGYYLQKGNPLLFVSDAMNFIVINRELKIIDNNKDSLALLFQNKLYDSLDIFK